MEQSKPLEEIDVWNQPPKLGIILNDERNTKFFEENQTDSLLQPLFEMTQQGMMRKLEMTSGLLREISSIAITWNPESNCKCRKKNHSLFHWKTPMYPELLTRRQMWCRRNILRIIGTWMEKKNYRMHGHLSKIHFIERKATWRIYMVREETHEETNNLKTRQRMARYVEASVWCSEKQSEAKVAIEKPKLDIARRLRGIFFIEPDDEEFKHTMKASRRKLEIPMSVAMPCKTPVNCNGETYRSIGKQDQRCLYCPCRRISENTIERVTAKVSRRSHCCKRNKFAKPLQFGAQVYSYASCKKNGCKGSSGERMVKLEKIPTWQLTKVRNKNEVIAEARNEGRKVHFASLMDLCHLKNSEVQLQFQKLQRQSCAPRWHCEIWFRIIRSIYWTRIISITNDRRKSQGHNIRIAGMRRTSSRRSIRLYPGQNGRCSDVVENSKVRMSRYWDTSTKTQMAKIMVQDGRSSCSSWSESVRSSFGRTTMWTAIREHFIEVRLGGGFQLGMLVHTPWKRVVLICVCGRYKTGCEKAEQ